VAGELDSGSAGRDRNLLFADVRAPLGRCDYPAASVFCPDGPAAAGELAADLAAAGAAAVRAGGASLPTMALPARLANDGDDTFIYLAGGRQRNRAAERSPVGGAKQVVGGASAMHARRQLHLCTAQE
jgi:hypothetical protein